jgi:predicted AAA+ superfamily ATPase
LIKRILTNKLLDLSKKFQIITITGPRQSGKTTLVKSVFPNFSYVSLEEPDIRQFALTDSRGFLSNYSDGVIFDEIQHVPDLFSYIQTIVDNDPKRQFILTGSSNFLLLEKISQTLAGRTAILHLLPLSYDELSNGGYKFEKYEALIFSGQYPRIFDRKIPPTDFYPSYIQTYVERDVRMIKNIGDINAFIQFIQLCAGRTGQLLNYSSLANDAGVSPNTVKSWISILEASYIVFRLQPHHRNFNKRLVKQPKLYFYDTGLACSLLRIQDEGQISMHFMKGALFENLIINEFIKRNFNLGKRQFPYFWQDNHGREIDCLLEEGERLIPIEMKSAKTIDNSYFDNLKFWYELTKTPTNSGYVVYGGEKSFKSNNGNYVGWRELDQIK